MSLLDRLQGEAADMLCEGCPERQTVSDLATINHGVNDEGMSRSMQLGVDVTLAARLIVTSILKDEVGCTGEFYCNECDKPHCGAQKDISLLFNFAASGE